ncbi:hypothetical protein [Nocardioides sp. SYSU D00038]|uniref:hypothetical protein n=1 Tax=Nocardioides sp. SYSU D00038 TaxID=2812554 RepID=UPI001967D97E|nr:hypothetical protein [Nocardioides sp. SYSU D00038]
MAERSVPQTPIEAAESWFLRHGLPYFVDDVRNDVLARLSRGRVVGVAVIGAVLGATTGVAAGLLLDAAAGVAVGASVLIGWLLLYALRALRAAVIAGWAVRRAFRSLGLLVPLATRALPMLLLFITFLFINTEVWQVASSLEGGVLWTAILFFALAAVGFLVPRLRQELDDFDDHIHEGDLVTTAAGTPLEQAAVELVATDDIDLPEEAQVGGLQMVNLVIVLLVAQLVQVFLLAVAVFLFFVVFGAVAIQEDVIQSWLGTEAADGTAIPHHLPGPELVSVELIRVSTFLAGFAGLYFTVTAITDDTYRREFFTVIMRELRRAVGARVVYRELCRRRDAAVRPPDPGPGRGEMA